MFAAFGSFWGVWGASVPRVQGQAGVTDGQLGLALMFVGGGALPAMLLVGRALDRWGLRLTAFLVGALGLAGAAMSLTSRDLVVLCLGLAVVGAASGATDVAMNAVAGHAEQSNGRPVITRAHGVFSTFVVLGGAGAGLAAALELPQAIPFLVVAVVAVAVGVSVVRVLPGALAPSSVTPPNVRSEASGPVPEPALRLMPLVLVGLLGALAFASENAHQSWSAVFAHAELGSGPGAAAVAPTVFAGTVAVTRFALGGLSVRHARTVLAAGALAAAAGALVVAVSPTLGVAALGLVLAAAGTAVLFPTLLGVVSRDVAEARRGRATSVVSGVSYLGFLLGPAYVGLWAETVGLRGAMAAVAGLGVLLLLTAPAVLRLSRRPPLGSAPPSSPGPACRAAPASPGRAPAGPRPAAPAVRRTERSPGPGGRPR